MSIEEPPYLAATLIQSVEKLKNSVLLLLFLMV